METINPFREIIASISPTEYEEYCTEILKGYAEKENLKDFTIQHDVVVSADDGDYQIDIYATFVAMGVQFKVLAECKRYSTPVKRDYVMLLADKVRSIGAQKGILISTSGFQSGAVDYARKHGIALIQIFDKCVMHIQNSLSATAGNNDAQGASTMLGSYNRPSYEAVQMMEYVRMPKYYAYEYHGMDYPDRQIYPTYTQVREIQKQMRFEFIQERFQHLLLFLESKRILVNPMYMELKNECIASVLEIKKELVATTKDGLFDDSALAIIRSMLTACNDYLDCVRQDSIPHLIYKDGKSWADPTFEIAMKKFRKEFQQAIRQIESDYALKYRGKIAKDY